ncbi:MAG: hypothetical protein IJQ78_09230 [Selenomonadaceae bacterium]|nr:hypothetical protein [Selenomonadaceae bacterium]
MAAFCIAGKEASGGSGCGPQGRKNMQTNFADKLSGETQENQGVSLVVISGMQTNFADKKKKAASMLALRQVLINQVINWISGSHYSCIFATCQDLACFFRRGLFQEL